MNAGEVAPRPLLSPQPLLNQRQDDVTVELRGSVLRKAGDAGLRGVPVALVLHIEMIGLLGEAVQRVAEYFFFNDTATTEIYTLSLHDVPLDRHCRRQRYFVRRYFD